MNKICSCCEMNYEENSSYYSSRNDTRRANASHALAFQLHDGREWQRATAAYARLSRDARWDRRGLGSVSGQRVWAACLGSGSGQRVWAAGLGSGSGQRVWYVTHDYSTVVWWIHALYIIHVNYTALWCMVPSLLPFIQFNYNSPQCDVWCIVCYPVYHSCILHSSMRPETQKFALAQQNPNYLVRTVRENPTEQFFW
jgi:hypothetical protein